MLKIGVRDQRRAWHREFRRKFCAEIHQRSSRHTFEEIVGLDDRNVGRFE